ncbi:hypothetical protein [Methylobacter tundripaludum]|uniref:Uncharacterized protein n=1 Tax=Methylobacter tundripaludum (strain ATCC BAA-1195 / DSM 17260 / SV96) TaxID=697282 RepID=G3IRC3_METTV|nr:hypothetical protein [Methylobacter tundripaludum]EGW22134.1 hypothetical protein Mettu_0935 [Methylobacter tundripaludum SV96]
MIDMKPAKFQVIYDGPALDNHEMDVHDLAPALMAIGSLMEEVGNSLYGDKFKIGVSVKGSFKTGCFGVEMVATAKSLILDAIDIFNHGNTTAVLNAAGIIGLANYTGGTLIGFLRWVRNRKITKTEVADNGIVRVYIDDDHYDIEKTALALLQNHKIRQAFENIITKPLLRDGIESFAIVDPDAPGKPLLMIDKRESIYFVAPDPGDEKINDQTTIVSLQIINASFADGNKWRFTDGIQTFYAEILDEDFLARVNASEEVFAKNDILKAKVQLLQWLTMKGMKSEYSILEVIEHRSANRQIDLFNP